MVCDRDVSKPSNVARAGAARRRRERRLRAMLRHERQTVAMELAAALHHSRDGGRETYYGLRAPMTASSGGRRPGVLKEPEPTNVVERVLRHTVDQIVVAVPLVPLLDDPVPQTVDTVLEFFRSLDLPFDEQVIAVPKISTDRVSQRLVERRLPQMVEQLVHVPTVLSPQRDFWHSSSSAWRKLESSWPSPRTEFNVVALADTHF